MKKQIELLLKENQNLKEKLAECKQKIRFFKKGFLFQEDVLTHINVSKQKAELTKKLNSVVTMTQTVEWSKEFKSLEVTFNDVLLLLEQHFSSQSTITVEQILEIQQEIEKTIDIQSWKTEDKEKLKKIIFVLSLLYSSLTLDSGNDNSF